MNKIKIEILKIFKSSSVYIGVILSLLSGCAMLYLTYNNPQSFQFRHTQAFYSSYFMEILLIYLVVTSIYKEYIDGTIKLIHDRKTGIVNMLFSKLIALLITGLLLSLINIAFILISFYVLKPDIDILRFCINIIFIYCIYISSAFSLSTVMLIFSNKISNTLLVSVILFAYSSEFIQLLGNKLNISSSNLDYIPFYSLVSGLRGFYHNNNILIGGLIFSLLFLSFGIMLHKKRDII